MARKTKPDDPVTALRRRRLREAVAAFDSVADFCRRYGLDEGYIGQLINGFSSFGEKSARNLQSKIEGLPVGYFESSDSAHPLVLKLAGAIRDGQLSVQALSMLEAAIDSQIAMVGKRADLPAHPAEHRSATAALKVAGEKGDAEAFLKAQADLIRPTITPPSRKRA